MMIQGKSDIGLNPRARDEAAPLRMAIVSAAFVAAPAWLALGWAIALIH